jgi:hypothetical protein
MRMDFVPLLIAWALVATGAVALALWRNVLRLHDFEGLYLAKGEERDAEEETRLTRKIARIDLWGKTLTVIAAVLIVGIGAAWLYMELMGMRPS